MSNENQPKIKELENREKELLEKIEQLRKAGEELSDKKMQKIGEIIDETESDNKKSEIDLKKEREYLDFIKNSDGDFNTEESNNSQNKELNIMRRKIQRDFANQEAKIGGPDGGIDEYKEEKSKTEKSPFIDYGKEYKNRKEYETDKKRKLSQKVSDLLDPLFSKNEEGVRRREANGNHFLDDKDTESKEKVEEKVIIKKIAELLKENKINEIIVGGGRNKDKIVTWEQDLDSSMALFLLNNFNKKPLENTYAEGSRSTILDIRNGEKEPQELTKGIRLFIDTGGTWPKIELSESGETTTIQIDHHGAGQREATSGTKMIYEIMDEADILKDKPEWLVRLVDFINNFDNLSYLENKDENGHRTFDKNYFQNIWPKTLYAISREIPFNILVELCQSGKIKDPSIPFTEEELAGELGKTKIGEFTISELCERALAGDKTKKEKNIGGSINTLKGIEDTQRYAKQEKLNLEETRLGKIIYQNFGKIKTKGKKDYVAKIERALAFIGTKAVGYDTFINWNSSENKFFINSNNPNLSEIVEELNKVDPDCAKDVRGVMVFGQIKNLTEEQFLNIIDPRILNPEANNLTPEEEKILSKAEAQIEEENKIISEAEKKIAELKSRLKVVEFKKKKEEQEKSKEKAKNKKVAKKQVGGKTIDD